MKKLLVLALAAGFALAGCDKKSGGAGDNSARADSMKTAYKAITAAFESGNTADLEKYIDPNGVDHQMPPGYPAGVDGLKKMIADFKAGYPDGKFTIEDVRVDGDILIARGKFSGTNSGPMMGMPATNKPVSDMMFIDWQRWQNGRFVEHWGVAEEMKMMTQLGLMPEKGAPADSGKKAM